MTKTIKFCIIFIMLLGGVANAQSGSGFGIKGGFNFGSNGDLVNAFNNASDDPSSRIGYHLGAFGKLSLAGKFYLRPELVYTKIQSEYSNSTSFDMSKLDLPVLLGYKIIGPLHVFAGPAFQYILNIDIDDFNINDAENDFSVGLNFGVGINLGKLGLDLRYERGFSSNEANILDNNNIDVARLDTRPEQLILSLSVKL